MPNISVTYDELKGAADQLVAGRDEITATLTRLQSQIADLTSAGFTTDRSSGAFADAYSRFTAGTRGALGGLDDLAAFLHAAAGALADVDAQLAARLGRW